MTGPESPTIRRWELAARLRRLREETGRSLDDVAQELLFSTSKLSRLETGARAASLRDVRDLCVVYGVDEVQREQLMALVREAKQPGWWQRFDEVSPQLGTYIGLEAAAREIQSYETIVVPGLLQTADYTRSLMRRLNPRISVDKVEQHVATRQERKKRLSDEDAPSYWAVLDEGTLRRQVGGTKVMKDQVEHLAQSVVRNLAVVQIVPFDAGAHAGMEGPFTIFGFGDRANFADVVALEGRAGQLYLDRSADLRTYREAMDHLRATAMSPDASLDLLHRIAAQLVE